MVLRAITYALIALLAVCLLPVAGVLASTTVADLAGCRLDEAGSYPCVVLGRDIGGTLAMLFVSGWFALVTLPLAGLIAAALLVIWLIRRRQSGSVR